MALWHHEARVASNDWLAWASASWNEMETTCDARVADTAASTATHCTERLLQRLLARHASPWTEGVASIDGVPLQVEFRDLSPCLKPSLRIATAQSVAMEVLGGTRLATPGFGVPLVVDSPPCDDSPYCALLPHEGVHRAATAWIEAPGAGATLPKLVIADPLRHPVLKTRRAARTLALDTSAPLAQAAAASRLHRLSRLGLVRSVEVARHAGVHVLQDYDPHKRTLVMIHGLGSTPRVWLRVTNAIWGDPELRARFQVWHVLYQTDAPTIVSRKRVQTYLEDAWHLVDPAGVDAAREGIVLIGHSLGGVVARLLCVDSAFALWDAGFTVPPEQVHSDPEGVRSVREVFAFTAYPGVTRAIFLAAPHRGSPKTSTLTGNIARVLIGRGVPEIARLRRLAIDHPDAVQPALQAIYRRGAVNSITSLQVMQPIRKASERLLPREGIRYHTIAGVIRHRGAARTDGTVPLDSALLEGAQSTLVIPSAHGICNEPAAIAEVQRILREDVRSLH